MRSASRQRDIRAQKLHDTRRGRPASIMGRCDTDRDPAHPQAKDSIVNANITPHALRSVATGIEEELLDQVGVVPSEASATDLMQAVSQLARQRLSQRWVRTQSLLG